jgi:HEAT repeat protein
MPITVTCACGGSYPIREEFAGQRVQCPACGQMLTIPVPTGGRPQPALDEVEVADEVADVEQVAEETPAPRRGGLWVFLGLLTLMFLFCGGLGSVLAVVLLAPRELKVALATQPMSPPAPASSVALPPPPSPPVANPVPPPPALPPLPELPDILARLDDPDPKARLDAARQLPRFGAELRPSLPVLVKALQRDDPEFRAAVLAVLNKLGSPAKADAVFLVPLFRDRSFPAGRIYALECLAALGADYPPTLPTFKAALDDNDVTVKRKAVQLAGQFGAAGRDALYPLLLDMLSDDDAELSKDVGNALAKLGKPSANELEQLNDLLRNRKAGVRRYALVALADMGPDAAKALPRIRETFTVDREADIRRLALVAIAKVQTDKREVAELLKRGLKDPDAEVNKQAVVGLAALAPDPDVLATLLEALNSSNPAVAKAAQEQLPKIKFDRAHAKGLAAALRAAKSDALRLRLMNTLVALKPETPEAGAALGEFLKDATDETRGQIIAAIGELGSAGREAGPVLAAFLKDDDKDLRFEVALTLCKIRSEEATKAVPALVAALRAGGSDDKPGLERQEKAHKALVALGKPAVDALAQSLEKEFFAGNPKTLVGASKADARGVVIKTLGLIGPDAKDAIPALGATERQDPVAANRVAARQARLKIQQAADEK